MLDWLSEPFTFDFLRQAALAGLLTAITTSLVGTWLVLRGMAFMSDALAHGVLPGLSSAYLLEINLSLGAGLAALVMIGGVHLVQRHARLHADTGIGLLFVGMLALGVVIASTAQSYAGDLTALLFGDINAVTDTHLLLAAGSATGTLLITRVAYRPLLALTLNERMAAVLGLRPQLTHAALLALLAGAIITAFHTVGVLLVFGFLIAPPATATLLARRVPLMMLTALGLAALAVLTGLLVSYHAGTAGAATIAVLMVAEFFLTLTATTLHTRLRTRRHTPTIWPRQTTYPHRGNHTQ